MSSCSYDDVVDDWTMFESSMRKKWSKHHHLAESYKTSTFQSWATTMYMALEKHVLNHIYQVLHSSNTSIYERYIDWVITTGLVPIVKQKPNQKLISHINEQFQNMQQLFSQNEKTIAGIVRGLHQEILNVVMSLTSTYIPDFSEVCIYFEKRTNLFYGTFNEKKITVEPITRPVFFKNSVVFDSSVQRLFHNIMACHRTTEHAKLCQLLNTAPFKVISGPSTGVSYKDIMNHLEESAHKNDPKKDLLCLLMKLSENKTVSGVTDVVEEFITDVSQNVVDKNKLYGSYTETTTQGLRRQVSDTVFKCLTKQINEQFDSIRGLEKEREMYLKQLQLLESQLSKSNKEESISSPDNLLISDTAKSLQNLKQSSLVTSTIDIPKGNTVMNSLISQYTPPFREIIKDLTALWENEIFQTFRLAPVVDNQGHRLYVRYTQDTISALVGPFTYTILKFSQMDLINEQYASMGLQDIGHHLYSGSRLSVYIKDVGTKYFPEIYSQDGGRSSEGKNVWSHKTTAET